MPLSNRAPIDASGNLLVTTTAPTAAWPSLGGMTYDPATGALAVIDAVPAVNDPWVGAIRFTNIGQMYVWSAALPAGVEYVGGIPVTDDGRMVVNGAGGGGTVVVGGWPISGSGGVPVSGLGPVGPVPIFFAPLLSTLVPIIAGNPAFTFTRATTAYAMDQDGILRQAQIGEARFQGARRVRNYVVGSSENATLAGWGFGSSSLSFGAIGPTGLPDASTITAIGPGGTAYNNGPGVIGNVAISSIWLKRRTGTGDVTIYSPNGAVVVVPVTTAWQRFTTGPVPLTATTISVGLTLAVGGDQVDFTYAQSEVIDGQSNQAPGEYVSVGVLAAPYHGAGVDGVKYFATTNGNSVAGNVVTEATGALIPAASLLGYVAENAATNLILQSQTFDNASWVKSNATVTPNTQAAPDGTLTADVLAATAANGTCYQSITVAAATHAFSINLKRIAGTSQVAITTDGVTYTDITSQLSSSVWTRVFTANPSAGVITPGVRVAVSGESVAMWGGQLEQASDPSSYIPTTTVAVTRNVDDLRYPSAVNFDGTVGSAYAEAYPPTPLAGKGQDIVFSGTSSFYMLAFDSSKKLFIYSGTNLFTANVRTVATVNKGASAWSATGRSLCLNGGAVATVGTFTPQSSGDMRIGNGFANEEFCGFIRNVKFYNVRIADVDLQAMTT